MRSHTVKFLLAAALVAVADNVVRAQDTTRDPAIPKAAATPANDFENLNYVAGDAAMPSFSDSVIDENSSYRQSFFKKGMALRVINQYQFAQNALDAPVTPQEQVYVGQRAYTSVMVQPIFTADLRQLHLKQAQLYAGGVWDWVSWNPAGPKTVQLWDLYLYKKFGKNRAEIKAGYVSNSLDLVGFFVGGSTAAGAQGVYAILPYEVGMSYFPLTSPSASIRIHGPRNTYFTTAVQRSLDPDGGPTEVARNHTGFRFAPHGDKILSISEGGLRRGASTQARDLWVRAGYMNNRTAYANFLTGRREAGNYCIYGLADFQLTQTDRDHPNRGLYVGGSAETAPEDLNAYARYYEARIYREAPFRRRPADVASIVASRTGYSRPFTNGLLAEGKTVWRAGTTVTASYTLRASRGNYVGLGLGYVNGPAISPRVPSALKFTASWTSFF